MSDPPRVRMQLSDGSWQEQPVRLLTGEVSEPEPEPKLRRNKGWLVAVIVVLLAGGGMWKVGIGPDVSADLTRKLEEKKQEQEEARESTAVASTPTKPVAAPAAAKPRNTAPSGAGTTLPRRPVSPSSTPATPRAAPRRQNTAELTMPPYDPARMQRIIVAATKVGVTQK